jgi:hypothetical protein
MGYLWTGQEWVWNPAHGPETAPSRYTKGKKPVQVSATVKEMQAYRREQERPADRTVLRLFAEIGYGGRQERGAWMRLVEYLADERHLI